MSTVNINNTEGLFPRAGNTVESLTPRYGYYAEEAANAYTPDKEVAENTPKETTEAETAGSDSELETFSLSIAEMNRLHAEWRSIPVNRGDLEDFREDVIYPLAKAVQDLAERIFKHNQSAPHKI